MNDRTTSERARWVDVTAAIVFGLVAVAGARAESEASVHRVGDRIDPITLQDQHGEDRTIDGSTRIVLFSRDMEGGDVLKEALADVPEDFLTTRDAVYVSDISGMPKLVARLFALPAMRRRPYPMLLDRDGTATARLPDREARATLIFLEELVIQRVLHAETPETVRRALEP